MSVWLTIRPYLYVFLAFLQAGFTSGIIFGWPALESILIKEGVYKSHCTNVPSPGEPCDAQKDFFNLCFTIAAFVNNAAPLITGIFLDRIGPKWTSVGSAALFFVGCGLFSIPSDYVIAPGYALLGLAGPGVYCSIMHLCNLFPGHQASVLSFFSGTFSASSFIFRIFVMLYRPEGWRDLGNLFLEYIVLISPLFVIGAFIWPNKAFKPPGKKSIVDADAEAEPLLNPSPKILPYAKSEPLYNVSVWRQFSAVSFYWMPVVWLGCANLNISCYMGTIEQRFPKSDLPTVFNYMWSFGWIAIPVFGAMMDYLGNTFSMNFASVGLVLFSALKLVPINDVQYATFAIIATVNVGLWAIFYSYLSSKFGFDNYGKLFGVASITVAVIGGLQYLFEWTITNVTHDDFFITDAIFMLISLFALGLSVYVWYLEKRVLQQKVCYPTINSPILTSG